MATPPEGFESYFGSAPYYKFIEYDGIGGIDTITDKIRNFPEGLSPEDTLRRLTKDDDLCDSQVIISAVDRLLDIIDADPEIDVRARPTGIRPSSELMNYRESLDTPRVQPWRPVSSWKSDAG